MEEKKERKQFLSKWCIALIIVFILLIVIASIVGKDRGKANTFSSTNSITSYNNVNNNSKTTWNKTEVIVADFSQMKKAEIESWCNTNKIKCTIEDKYSDNIEKGLFVSQSVNANSTIYQGDKITVVFSLGKEPTMGEKNALSMAKQYLNTMAFSYTGLIKQLEYEGFSVAEATYGADNCGADWNEQAFKMAKKYIEYMSFSRSGLIEQLKYEGFTNEQAEYGATAVGY